MPYALQDLDIELMLSSLFCELVHYILICKSLNFIAARKTDGWASGLCCPPSVCKKLEVLYLVYVPSIVLRSPCPICSNVELTSFS